MDTQAILIFILSVLTINLVVVGVYVILVLKEVRELIKKAHEVADTVESITDAFSNPFNVFGDLIGAVVDGYKAVKEVQSIRSIK